jgi:hypothetical protein
MAQSVFRSLWRSVPGRGKTCVPSRASPLAPGLNQPLGAGGFSLRLSDQDMKLTTHVLPVSWVRRQNYTVCPQSPLGVLKNCGAQTN